MPKVNQERPRRFHEDLPLRPVPLELQLDAACSLELRTLNELLRPYGFRWHSGSSSRMSDYKHFFTFSSTDLLSYLGRYSATCGKLLMHSYDQRSSPNTFMEEHKGKYRVGWCDRDGKLSDVEEFDKLEEAAADYVLFTLGLDRLRSKS
jgi:hypothetical protein